MVRALFVISLLFTLSSYFEPSYDIADNNEISLVKQLIVDNPQDHDSDFDFPLSASYSEELFYLLNQSYSVINKTTFIVVVSAYQLTNPRAPPRGVLS